MDALEHRRQLLDAAEEVSPILRDIMEEAMAQENQWGGLAHDVTVSHSDWLTLIEKQMGFIFRREGDPQERYIKIAALCFSAIAAIQSQGCQTSPVSAPDTSPPPLP